MSIKSLAAEMDVSESDVAAFARNVIHELSKDGMDSKFLEVSESDREDITQAYAACAVKRMQAFHTAYITNTEVKSAVDDAVYAELKHGGISDHAETLRARGLL